MDAGERKYPSDKNNGIIRENLYEEMFIYLKNAFESVKEQSPFPVETGFQIMRKIVEDQPSKDPLLIKAIHYDDLSNYIICHGVNVAIFAVKMGHNLGFNIDRQIEIGMTGLLHDIGMAIVPEPIINKSEKLSNKELKAIREHPDYGYQILKSAAGMYPYLADCALQIHERIDGSGYPAQLKGDEIQEYAQIIGLIDIYEAMIHSRPYRKKLLPFSASKEIITICKKNFKRIYLKTFLNVFSIFPISTYVRLNSQAIGQVIETYPEQPMRPKLRIVYDSQKRRILGDIIINLPDNSLLYIVDSVSNEEIQN